MRILMWDVDGGYADSPSPAPSEVQLFRWR
jgi:hypothetical protein